jgi:hypothetical protein
MICLDVKVQIRMIQQKQLENSLKHTGYPRIDTITQQHYNNTTTETTREFPKHTGHPRIDSITQQHNNITTTKHHYNNTTTLQQYNNITTIQQQKQLKNSLSIQAILG